jgi:hypothetical protein
MIKKVIQQGRSDFDARSVLPVREHDKIARTPLVAFFNIPIQSILSLYPPGVTGRAEQKIPMLFGCPLNPLSKVVLKA